MEKRGLSHVEAIISFVIFIAFLIFALYFFNPFQNNNVLDSTLTYSFNEIKKDSSVKLETYSVFVEDNVVFQIVSIPSPSVIGGVNAFDSNENSIESGIAGNVVSFLRPANGFVKLRFSEAFEINSLGGGSLLNPNDYTISSSQKEDILSEEKILELNESYYSDYEGLKERFNLPRRIDFGFRIVFDNGEEIISEKEVPEGLEVFSERERVRIIRTDEKITFAELIVKTW